MEDWNMIIIFISALRNIRAEWFSFDIQCVHKWVLCTVYFFIEEVNQSLVKLSLEFNGFFFSKLRLNLANQTIDSEKASQV